MIKISNLSKSFGNKQILNNLNLEISDNETLVILGPSGQGKTVLIKTLVRLIEPDSGSVEFDGIDILSLKRQDLTEFRKRLAFVFQNSALFDFLSVKDNLSLFMIMHQNAKPKEINEKIMQTLSFVGLNGDSLKKFPEELSGGMRKRVAIARAMINQPQYIFYDEPTTGLDKTNAEKISDLIKLLKSKINATAIIVTHDIDLMRAVSDRVVLLKDGCFSFIGNKNEISDDALDDLYKGVDNGL
jgi:phospholipid/cholesterol/gamma-HCH transport system ATP-binding protein